MTFWFGAPIGLLFGLYLGKIVVEVLYTLCELAEIVKIAQEGKEGGTRDH